MYFLVMGTCSCDFIVMLLSIYVTVLAKTGLVRTKLNSILLPQFTDTLKIYPSPVYQVLIVNWSTFLEQLHPWRAPIG